MYETYSRDIAEQVNDLASEMLDAYEQKALSAGVRKNKEEFARIVNDMRCYQQYAIAFRYKVLAAEQVLNYKWSKDVNYLEKAIPLLEKSNVPPSFSLPSAISFFALCGESLSGTAGSREPDSQSGKEAYRGR